jgi:hypothetical protein
MVRRLRLSPLTFSFSESELLYSSSRFSATVLSGVIVTLTKAGTAHIEAGSSAVPNAAAAQVTNPHFRRSIHDPQSVSAS